MIDVIIIGGGKFAGNIVDEFSSQINPVGYIDSINNQFLREKYNIRFLGNDIRKVSGKKKFCNNLVLCIGSEGNVHPRTNCFIQLKRLRYYFPLLIHENSMVSRKTSVGEGSIVQSHCVIQANVKIGKASIISSNTFIGHDSILGDYIFVGPGVNIGGSVVIKEKTHVSIGAVVLQKINIGKNCLIGASSCVICDVPDNSKVRGIPAK